jgi:hypothetical protein
LIDRINTAASLRVPAILKYRFKASPLAMTRSKNTEQSKSEENDSLNHFVHAVNDFFHRSSALERNDQPSLFNEVIEMMVNSVSVFTIADFRRLARANIVSAPEFLELPQTTATLLSCFAENQEIAKAKMKSNQIRVMQSLLDTNEQTRHLLENGTLHYVGDEKADEECVYAITTNSYRKRIVVMFRGSITVRDWIQDSKFILSEVQNPLAGESDQPETIRLHKGFSEYLYHNSPSVLLSTSYIRQAISGSRNEGGVEASQSKLEEVLDKVKALLDQYPEYNVYITGYSLGGALSLIMAMEAALKLSSKGPITCIVFGNPRVGNRDFLHVVRVSRTRPSKLALSVRSLPCFLCCANTSHLHTDS